MWGSAKMDETGRWYSNQPNQPLQKCGPHGVNILNTNIYHWISPKKCKTTKAIIKVRLTMLNLLQSATGVPCNWKLWSNFCILFLWVVASAITEMSWKGTLTNKWKKTEESAQELLGKVYVKLPFSSPVWSAPNPDARTVTWAIHLRAAWIFGQDSSPVSHFFDLLLRDLVAAGPIPSQFSSTLGCSRRCPATTFPSAWRPSAIPSPCPRWWGPLHDTHVAMPYKVHPAVVARLLVLLLSASSHLSP